MQSSAPALRRLPTLLWALAFIAAAGALGLAITAVGEGGFALDVGWAAWLAGLREPFGLAFSYALNWLGGGFFAIWVVPLAGALLLVLLRRPWSGLLWLLALAASAGLVQVAKHLFARVRPQDMIVTSDYGSFPSGHVANAATIAVLAAIIWPFLWVRIVGVVWVLAMAFSRTYLGAHWLTDTVGGALLGAGAVLLVAAALHPLLQRERGGDPGRGTPQISAG